MKITTFENFLEEGREIYRLAELEELRKRFPYQVWTEGYYPEIDNAARWCWRHIGPQDGPCVVTHHNRRGYWISVWGGPCGDKLYTFKGIDAGDLRSREVDCGNQSVSP